jgi:phosphatidate phosphatase APP1
VTAIPTEGASQKPSRRHPAAVVDDTTNAVAGRLLRGLGWVPGVVPYVGYGAAPGVPGCHGDGGWVRVLARVLLTRPSRYGRPVPPRRGWRQFLTAAVPGAVVVVTVAGREHQVVADRSGVVDVVLPSPLLPGEHAVEISAGHGEPFRAAVVVHGPDTRYGLVSDIDDTVMVTWLPRPLLAAWNAFVVHESARRVVPGMAELYRRLAERHRPLGVWYLSTGAWNVAPALSRFLRRHQYPWGPLLLTDWGPTNTGWFRSGREHKTRELLRLAAEFPGLRWILVGDDGQHDPEIYRDFVRARPGRVGVVALRQLTPTEQVLSRGRLGGGDAAHLAGVVVAEGPDGDALGRRLAAAGVVPG